MIKRLFGRLNLWLVIGVLILCGLPSASRQTLTPLWEGVPATGEVIQVIPSGRNRPLELVVRFQTTTGETVTTRIDGHPFYRYDQGQQIRLLYLPSNPQKISLPELISMGMLLLIVTALLFGGIPLWVGIRKMQASVQQALQ